MRISQTGKKRSLEARQRQAKSIKELWTDSVYRAKNRTKRGQQITQATKDKIRAAARRQWNNPEQRERLLTGIRRAA